MKRGSLLSTHLDGAKHLSLNGCTFLKVRLLARWSWWLDHQASVKEKYGNTWPHICWFEPVENQGSSSIRGLMWGL